jgi:hypothetical protein
MGVTKRVQAYQIYLKFSNTTKEALIQAYPKSLMQRVSEINTCIVNRVTANV